MYNIIKNWDFKGLGPFTAKFPLKLLSFEWPGFIRLGSAGPGAGPAPPRWPRRSTRSTPSTGRRRRRRACRTWTSRPGPGGRRQTPASWRGTGCPQAGAGQSRATGARQATGGHSSQWPMSWRCHHTNWFWPCPPAECISIIHSCYYYLFFYFIYCI